MTFISIGIDQVTTGGLGQSIEEDLTPGIGGDLPGIETVPAGHPGIGIVPEIGGDLTPRKGGGLDHVPGIGGDHDLWRNAGDLALGKGGGLDHIPGIGVTEAIGRVQGTGSLGQEINGDLVHIQKNGEEQSDKVGTGAILGKGGGEGQSTIYNCHMLTSELMLRCTQNWTNLTVHCSFLRILYSTTIADTLSLRIIINCIETTISVPIA